MDSLKNVLAFPVKVVLAVFVSSFDQLLIDDYEIRFNKRDCDVAQTLGCIDLISRVNHNPLVLSS